MPDADEGYKCNESRKEHGSVTRSGLPIPSQLKKKGMEFPPNSFMTVADKRHALIAIYMIYWLGLLGYAATVRVLAAPGNVGSRALGYIDRAQDIENYCIATTAFLITSCIGALAIVGVPMSAVAIDKRRFSMG
ncbi:uncharacterized protein BP5553_01670 [Venustampulla echinocandica]|uniref:Uncharacterized protein n=1 Tax=Venustampulla echinocandica TaxID=2656787 RepID=A0A370U1Q2_9HELO|nr:uncharacterized protein BP5553_01670 [Venustampulla echinocandica]RDL41691.1 hypothetical protein BP5553_01670 [Venustampulla echinocandica]